MYTPELPGYQLQLSLPCSVFWVIKKAGQSCWNRDLGISKYTK